MFSYDYLILLSNILIVAVPVHSQSKPSLGISSCYYVGDVYVDCGSQNVSIAEIPKECTAIIVDGIDMTEKNKVKSPGEEKQFPADLDLILKSSKNVFIFYGHHTEEEWAQVLNTENDHKEKKLNEEMKALKTYLDQHPGIKGLIIKNLEFDANSTNVSNYSENLKVYLDAMRSNFPNMSIGLFLGGKFVVDQYNNPKLTWLNFTIIDPSVDFYIISVVTFNECTDQFRLLGTAPIGKLPSITSTGVSQSNVSKISSTNSTSTGSTNSSSTGSTNSSSTGSTNSSSTGSTNSSSTGSTNLTMPDTNYTLSNLVGILEDIFVPPNKTYYMYRLGPLSNDNSTKAMCETTVTKICLNSTDSSSWCYETIDSFNAKGEFAKDNGAGFVVNSIKIDDPKNVCKCGPYPSFNAILDGFNGNKSNITKECALSNRS